MLNVKLYQANHGQIFRLTLIQKITGDVINDIVAQDTFQSIYPQKGGAVYASAWWEPHLNGINFCIFSHTLIFTHFLHVIAELELYQTGTTCLGSILPAPSRGPNGEALIHHIYSDGPCVYLIF